MKQWIKDVELVQRFLVQISLESLVVLEERTVLKMLLCCFRNSSAMLTGWQGILPSLHQRKIDLEIKEGLKMVSVSKIQSTDVKLMLQLKGHVEDLVILKRYVRRLQLVASQEPVVSAMVNYVMVLGWLLFPHH